jgi:hypothetical protein
MPSAAILFNCVALDAVSTPGSIAIFDLRAGAILATDALATLY